MSGCDGGTVKDAFGKHQLIPDLLKLCGEGQEFIIAFDEDADEKTQKRVKSATKRLGHLLQEEGAIVKIARWSNADGKGIDDFVVKHGPEVLEAIINSAFEMPKPGFKPTQGWLAEQGVQRWKERLIYDVKLQDWLKYKSEQQGIWSVVSPDLIGSALKDVAAGFLGEDFNHSLVKGALELLRIDRNILKPKSDRSDDVLTFRNTAIRLSTGEVISFAPENHARWALERDYDPNQKDWKAIAEQKALAKVVEAPTAAWHFWKLDIAGVLRTIREREARLSIVPAC